jgi:hypothetical protein
MDELEDILQQIVDNLDGRRAEFTRLKRMVITQIDKPLESTAIRMGIPMIYAEWEGYIREVCQLYLEYIESTVKSSKELNPPLLGHMWTPLLRPLVGGLNPERKTSLAKAVISCLDGSVIFAASEKAIDTKSNLNFRVLESIASSLCLEIDSLTSWKSHLNALVDIRNNIAHGSRPTSLTLSDFERMMFNTLRLMEEFEKILISAVSSGSFCGQAAYASGG